MMVMSIATTPSLKDSIRPVPGGGVGGSVQPGFADSDTLYSRHLYFSNTPAHRTVPRAIEPTRFGQ